MNEDISKRFAELIQEGTSLANQIPHDRDGDAYWMNDSSLQSCQRWMVSVTNLVNIVTTKKSIYRSACENILTSEDMQNGVPTSKLKKFFGILTSANDEWERGLLRDVEYLVSAETFDDFLDHATVYHKGNKKVESAVLASSVLEDTIKKICKKNDIETSGNSLESLIDSMVEEEVITLVKGKRMKGFTGVRNYALHAEWDEFDISDVGNLIKGLRELISDHL